MSGLFAIESRPIRSSILLEPTRHLPQTIHASSGLFDRVTDDYPMQVTATFQLYAPQNTIPEKKKLQACQCLTSLSLVDIQMIQYRYSSHSLIPGEEDLHLSGCRNRKGSAVLRTRLMWEWCKYDLGELPCSLLRINPLTAIWVYLRSALRGPKNTYKE